ncbi:MAG: DUF4007 family protein [Lachnospiraceae bacterium]|nr:DUF4007 family protein [Lachnospiraceae bacterium]
MIKKKYRFKGHESFVLREGWLNKGLRETERDPLVFTKNYGADALGVGPNMAKSIRYWMRCSNLIEEKGKKGVFLSALGQKIWRYDAYLEDYFSLWLIHCNIVKNREQATCWNLFFNFCQEMEFTKDELVKEMFYRIENIERIENFSEKSVENDCETILRMYVKKIEKESDPEEKNISPFGIFELLKQKDHMYWKNQPNLNLLPAEIVYYLLLDCVSKERSVNIDELLKMPDSPGCLLHLKRTGLIDRLEILEKKEWIQMNRTAGLDMVYLKKEITKEEVVDQYFQQLR